MCINLAPHLYLLLLPFFREKYEPGLYRLQHPPSGSIPDARVAIAAAEGQEAAFDLTILGCPPMPWGGAAGVPSIPLHQPQLEQNVSEGDPV